MSEPVFSDSIFIPEVELYTEVKRIETKIKESITADPTDNVIHKVFKTHPAVGDFNYINEAIKFFQNKELDVKVGFNIGTSFPAVNILLPYVQDSRSSLGLSSELEYTDDSKTVLEEVKEKFKEAKYSIMFVGDNGDLIALLYYVFDYMLLADSDRLEAYGFYNVNLSGSDLSVERSLIPMNLFMRSLSVGFTYQVRAMNIDAIIRGKGYNLDKTKIEMNKPEE